MNRREHLFTILAEECGEVAQRASKINRFGVDEVQVGHADDNATRLVQEWSDLVGMMEMLQDEGHIPVIDAKKFFAMKEAKKIKVEKYLKLSKEQGTLTSTFCPSCIYSFNGVLDDYCGNPGCSEKKADR